MIGKLLLRDLRRGFSGAAWLPIAFFLLVATLMPFAIGRSGGRFAQGLGAIEFRIGELFLGGHR